MQEFKKKTLHTKPISYILWLLLKHLTSRNVLLQLYLIFFVNSDVFQTDLWPSDRTSKSILAFDCTLCMAHRILWNRKHSHISNTLYFTLIVSRLQVAFVSRIHVGRSRRSVSTISSNSKSERSPSPFSVLTLILSAAKFFVNLQRNVGDYTVSN